MAVDDPEAGDRQHVGRQQPGIADAEPEVGLVRAHQRREARLVGNDAHVEMRGGVAHEQRPPLDRIVRRTVGEARDEQGDGLVPRGARDRIEIDGRTRMHREQDDAPGRRWRHPAMMPARPAVASTSTDSRAPRSRTAVLSPACSH
jgi:hypothetical protein